MELLLVKATLENASGKQLDGRPAMEELLQKMRDSAQKAENVLDELDYFRIHDELNGTFDAADENPKGCSHDIVQNARHTAKAFGKLFSCATAGNPREEEATQRVPCCPQLRARRKEPGGSSSAPSTTLNQASEEVRGCTHNSFALFLSHAPARGKKARSLARLPSIATNLRSIEKINYAQKKKKKTYTWIPRRPHRSSVGRRRRMSILIRSIHGKTR